MMAPARMALSTIVTLLLALHSTMPAVASDQYHDAQREHQTLQHRVKLTHTGFKQHYGTILPTRTDEKMVHYEGDDNLTIEQVKALDETIENERKHVKNRKKRNAPESLDDTITFEDDLKSEQESPDINRDKRDFIHFYGSTIKSPNQQQTFHSYHHLSSSPLYVPIWGNPARIPIFFPLKPILFNPGYPNGNPQKPPNTPTTGDNTETGQGGITVDENGNPVQIGTRAKEPDYPIWGVVDSSEVGGSNQLPGTSTTSRPLASRKPETPSLFHKPSLSDDVNNNRLPPSDQNFPTTFRPVVPPFRPTSPPFNPQTNRPFNPPTTSRPTEPTLTVQAPSRCVWAVISCCSPLSTNVRYSCFEQLGCSGPFWGTNPCSREITTAALNAAQRFYEQSGRS